MKITLGNLEAIQQVFGLAIGRVNRPENYAIRRNRDRIETALKPLQDAIAQEPISYLNSEDATDEQKKQGMEALVKEREIEVDFEAYKLDIGRAAECLSELSGKRETLNADQLKELNEDYELAVNMIGMYSDDA